MKCPVCKLSTGYYKDEQVNGSIKNEPYPLYQRSYPDNKSEYISPRCSKCYDRKERRRIKEGKK